MERVKFPPVETLWIPCLGQQFLGSFRVIAVRWKFDRWIFLFHAERTDGSTTGHVDISQGLPIDGQTRRLPDPGVGPGRLRVPLGCKVENPLRGTQRRQHPELRVFLQVLVIDTLHEAGNVYLAPLGHGQAGSCLGDDMKLHSFDVRNLSPVPFKRLAHQPYPGYKFYKFIGPRAHGMLFKPGIPYLFHVLFRDYPADRGYPGYEILQKVGEGFLELDSHQRGIYGFHLRGFIVDEFCLVGLVSPEAVHDILRGHRVPVVKLRPFAQLEFVHLGIGTDRPGFGQAGGESSLRAWL